ncbi:MAG: transglutaminase domain-containing protein [Phycisphaerales bacterium]|nr:transglutaminase domain-containing protein [Phycisphaerales bacterium]
MMLRMPVVLALAIAAMAAGAGSEDVRPSPSAPVPNSSAPADGPAVEWKVIEDNWYALALSGRPVGWMHVEIADDGARYRTTNDMELAAAFAGSTIKVSRVSEWEETHAGRSLRISEVDRSVPEPVRWEWTFEGKPSRSIDDSGEMRVVRMEGAAPAGDWLSPMAIRRLLEQKIREGASELSYETLDAGETIKVVRVTNTLVGPDEVVVEGRAVPVTVWTTANPAAGTETVSSLERTGRLVHSIGPFGPGLLETRLVTKETARSPASVPPPVAVGRAPILLKGTIGNPADLSRAVYRIRSVNEPLPPLPSTGCQQAVVASDRRSAEVVVDLEHPMAATAAESIDAHLTERSPMLDTSDREVLRLASAAMLKAEGLGPMEIAKAACAVVREHVNQPGPPEVFASAAEAARSREGDSSERAGLLAAVLRVHGIPARVVSGLVWQRPGIAQPDAGAAVPGPHSSNPTLAWGMWTQAIVDGRWIDLDPSSESGFDVGHILLGASSLSPSGLDPGQHWMSALPADATIELVESR